MRCRYCLSASKRIKYSTVPCGMSMRSIRLHLSNAVGSMRSIDFGKMIDARLLQLAKAHVSIYFVPSDITTSDSIEQPANALVSMASIPLPIVIFFRLLHPSKQLLVT